jgi:hypothetical protein
MFGLLRCWNLFLTQRDAADGELQVLVGKYKDVFVVPSVLPPPRPSDHNIPLIPGSATVNYQPYRYSPFHKTKIEKHIIELLQARLVVPSVSPFASPVLLVQKKDGSWRFCMDYRKLNGMTIKNRFVMLVVEEIMDESLGTKFFLAWT